MKSVVAGLLPNTTVPTPKNLQNANLHQWKEMCPVLLDKGGQAADARGSHAVDACQVEASGASRLPRPRHLTGGTLNKRRVPNRNPPHPDK